LDVILKGINQIIKGGNTLEQEVLTVQANQLTAATQLTASTNTILAAIARLPQTGDPVTLPTAPTGYGGADADAIWGYTVAGDNRTTGARIVTAGRFGVAMSQSIEVYQRVRDPAGWSISGDWANPAQDDPSHYDYSMVVDPSTILPTDASFTTWLTRVYPSLLSSPYSNDGTGHILYAQPSSDWLWRLDFGIAEFAAYQGHTTAPILNIPPVWPLDGNVTFISGGDLNVDDVIEGPMHGCEVLITSAPPGSAAFIFSDKTSYRYLGALAFEDDDGYVETPQNLGFDHAVYCPKTMAVAARVRFRVKQGVTGPVYPFTIP